MFYWTYGIIGPFWSLLVLWFNAIALLKKVLLLSFLILSWSVVQFVKRAAAAEVPLPPQGQQQRPATPNGHRASVELEILKQLKDENDQIRERS